MSTGLQLEQVAAQGERLTESLIPVRRDLHMYPEIAFEEERTAGVVADALRALGLTVRTKVGGHGVVADLHGPAAGPGGRIVALRADMDALPILEETGLPFASKKPGVMHACGHDAHTTMLLGAARILTENRQHLKGTVRFLFQSAEEIVAGAKEMIKDGALEGVSEIYGLHNLPTLPAGMVATRYGSLMGSVDRLEITIHGKGGHGAMPDQTVDPIVAASAVVTGLQTAVSREISPFDPVVVTIGSFQAGTTNNVIPNRAELRGTVRTFSKGVQELMEERIARIIGRIAEGYRCQADVKYLRQVPVLVNHAQCVDHVNRVADSMLGAERRTEAAPTLGGEDFAVYVEQVPGCFFWLGSGPAQGAERAYGLHHPQFDINESCLGTGAAMLAAVALERLGEAR